MFPSDTSRIRPGDLPTVTEVVSGGAGPHTRILREPGPSYRHPQMSMAASVEEQSREYQDFHVVGEANST